MTIHTAQFSKPSADLLSTDDKGKKVIHVGLTTGELPVKGFSTESAKRVLIAVAADVQTSASNIVLGEFYTAYEASTLAEQNAILTTLAETVGMPAKDIPAEPPTFTVIQRILPVLYFTFPELLKESSYKDSKGNVKTSSRAAKRYSSAKAVFVKYNKEEVKPAMDAAKAANVADVQTALGVTFEPTAKTKKGPSAKRVGLIKGLQAVIMSAETVSEVGVIVRAIQRVKNLMDADVLQDTAQDAYTALMVAELPDEQSADVPQSDVA